MDQHHNHGSNRALSRDVPDINLTGYQIVDDRIRPDTGYRIQKISVVLSQLCSDHLNQLAVAVNVIELPCCCLFVIHL